MPDFVDGREAFREAVRQAELAAEAAAQETPSPLPELSEAVPVETSDAPAPLPEATEPAEADTPEAEEQTPAEAAAERLLAGKYRSVEELEAAYAEAQSVLGRQGQEVGELRQAVDQLTNRVSQQATPTPAPVMVTPELIEQDPGRATLLAYEQGNEQALAMSFDAWKDEDPFTAGTWLAERRAEQREAALRQEIEGVKQQIQTVSAPQQEAAEQRQWGEAFALVQQKHADFTANAERILTEVAPNYPAILQTLATGDPKAKAEILTALYAIDRASNTDPVALARQLQEEADRTAEESRLARAGASVVTQATAGQGSSIELTPEQQEAAAYKARLAGRVDIHSRGWTGRSGS